MDSRDLLILISFVLILLCSLGLIYLFMDSLKKQQSEQADNEVKNRLEQILHDRINELSISRLAGDKATASKIILLRKMLEEIR